MRLKEVGVVRAYFSQRTSAIIGCGYKARSLDLEVGGMLSCQVVVGEEQNVGPVNFTFGGNEINYISRLYNRVPIVH